MSRKEVIRVPPNSIEAEQSVLGGVMLVPEAWDCVAGRLVEDHFYSHAHRLIYRAIASLSEIGRPFDAVTLGEWLESQGLAERVGGTSYLVDLVSQTPSAANIDAYIEIVLEKALLRGLIQVGTEIANSAYDLRGMTPEEALASAEQRVLGIAERGRTGRFDFLPLRTALKEAFELLQTRADTQGTVTGLPTGFVDFDEMTAGLQPSDLIILAARPAMGKTSLAMNMAENAMLKSGKAVAVYSMEMSASQLAFRLMSSIGRINANKLRTGQLEDEDWTRLTHAIAELSKLKLFIDDTPALSPDVLRAKARRHKREHDIGLIVIDYLQLMQVPGNTENRATEISEISRSLKALAKELNVPVIALSQLNRGLESRTEKRPVMSDLRESGAIEQDADIVVFIYRDDYYHKDSPDKGLAEVIIGKQRNGPTGTVKLKFFGEHTRFDNLSHDAVGTFE